MHIFIGWQIYDVLYGVLHNILHCAVTCRLCSVVCVSDLVDVTLGWIFNGPSLPRRRTDGVCVDKKQTCVNSRSVNHSEAI